MSQKVLRQFIREAFDGVGPLHQKQVAPANASRQKLRDLSVISTALHETLRDDDQLTHRQVTLIEVATAALYEASEQLASDKTNDGFEKSDNIMSIAEQHFGWCKDPVGAAAKFLIKSARDSAKIKGRTG